LIIAPLRMTEMKDPFLRHPSLGSWHTESSSKESAKTMRRGQAS
jgi:hypothetical protein